MDLSPLSSLENRFKPALTSGLFFACGAIIRSGRGRAPISRAGTLKTGLDAVQMSEFRKFLPQLSAGSSGRL
jgi:hypothetical protein